MTTLIVKGKSMQALNFLEFARSLPYVEVAEEKQRRFKPEVEASLQKSLRGEDLVKCKDIDDMFKKLGIPRC